MAGPALPINRTTASTIAEHVSDHNAAHNVVNKIDKDATPATGDVLKWNGTVYAPAVLPVGGVVNVKDVAYGATGNGSTDDTAAIIAARNAVLNSRTGSAITDAPSLPTLYFPPGAYKITTPDALLPTGGTYVRGYTIEGAGYETTKILFQPVGGSSTLTNMNLITAVATGPRLQGMRIRNIGFESNNANASFAYLFSTTTAWVQDTRLDNVKFGGTWKRAVGLDGDTNANLNSEMTFNRVVTTGASFSDAVVHSGLTTPGTFANQDLFLNYWFYDCKFEQATGDTLVFDKGGHIVVIGGSWIVGDSGTGTHFKMGNYSHYDSVQFLKVIGARFELRNTNSRVIDCSWRGGHVSFDNCDDESHGYVYQLNGAGGGTANYDTHVYRTPSNGGPTVRYQDCALMGYHRVQTTATIPSPGKWIYDGCNFRNMQAGGAALLSSAVGQFLRYDSAVPKHRFVDCLFTTDVNV